MNEEILNLVDEGEVESEIEQADILAEKIHGCSYC